MAIFMDCPESMSHLSVQVIASFQTMKLSISSDAAEFLKLNRSVNVLHIIYA